MVRKITRFITVLAVNIIVFILIVAGVEYGSSFFADTIGGNLVTVYRLNHIWSPNTEYLHDQWVDNPDFPEPFIHYYNLQGWIEDYDVELVKPPNTYRIFYIGDSFTEGTVPMDQSVPSVVEKKLNELAKDKDLQFEVINTGTASYSPTIYYVLTRYVLMDYSPDLIVVNVDMTDDFDDWKYAQTVIRDDEGNPWAVPRRGIYDAPFIDTVDGVIQANIWVRIQLFLIEKSYTYNLIRKYVKPEDGTIDNLMRKYAAPEDPATDAPNGDDSRIYQRWAWVQEDWDEFTVKNVDYTLDLLRRLAIYAHENNVKIMFTAVPHYWQYVGDESGGGKPRWSSRPHYEIAKIAAENSVPYLNSFEQLAPMLAGTPQTDFYYKGDIHFNPRGYHIWAQAHLEFLTNEAYHLLPDNYYK